MQADVVNLHHGTIALGAVHGNLELARQEGKLRVEGAPLADDFGQRAGVHHFIRCDTGELIAGHVADTVT